MPEALRKFDARGRLEWLWRSSISTGLLFFLVAAVSRDFFLAVGATGVIITGLADYVDHRNRRLWWALVSVGIILVAGGIYLSIKNYQLSDFFHNMLKP
jgi:membrane protease YdiL (CAAX protease family)